MEKSEILKDLGTAVINGNKELGIESAQNVLESGIDPLEAVEQGLSKGMGVIGGQFANGESFLPELMMAADTFSASMEILKPAIELNKSRLSKAGTVLLATVKGDLHNIGKNIVGIVMETNGFEVVDIGIDQSTLNIIEAAEKNRADIIALSSLMTTTMPNQKELIDVLEEMKIRDKYLVLVGGGPTNQKWAHKIGADGYGETAVDAVNISKKLLDTKTD